MPVDRQYWVLESLEIERDKLRNFDFRKIQ